MELIDRILQRRLFTEILKAHSYMLVILFLRSIGDGYAQETGNIHINQIGFYPSMPKVAVVRGASNIPFYILSVENTDTVFCGVLSPQQYWKYSDEHVNIADFSSLTKVGTYRLSIAGVGMSSAFQIRGEVHRELAKAAVKGFYYQRASTPLLPEHAGKWARPAGHPDTVVLIHPSAASHHRPAGTRISSHGGWYDAGDYNKYIVNSGISTYTLLATYEHFPEFCSSLTLNIPESNNTLPDILDEALWNVRWMLTMQDPHDGGVYHKLTNEHFGGFMMPHLATETRYVVKKTTAAALDFAAVMAQMARIARRFPDEVPGLADSCLTAALQAWSWARSNPNELYNQKELNEMYDPDIFTGEYNDTNVADEFAWAAAELFVTTRQDSFLIVANPLSFRKATVPAWPEVHTLGLYTFAHFRKEIASVVDSLEVLSQLTAMADSLVEARAHSAYGIVMGASSTDFGWGSNAVAANQGMALLVAYTVTKNRSYLDAALSNLDYLLGRNPLNLCFVTGYGVQSPRNIHHRITGSDGIDEPFPGLLVGGPNPKREDRLPYPSTLPALAYLDDEKSFASNEICINWNAPVAYLSVGIEAVVYSLSKEN